MVGAVDQEKVQSLMAKNDGERTDAVTRPQMEPDKQVDSPRTLSNEEIIARMKASDLTQVRNLRALFDMARNTDDIALCKFARERAETLAFDGNIEAYELVKDTYLWAAPKDFDSYLIYLEWNRKPEERFYLPRRKRLLEVVSALQALSDDRLDELCLSFPPRTGKTSLLMFYMTWLMGRDGERSNLYCAYSDTITQAFYNGVLEILNDPKTYLWKDVFPEHKIVATNSKNETINIDRNKRYASLTCRSLYGTLNGAADCDGILVSDDLLSGIEEALNKDRLATVWGKVDNNMLTRAKGNAKILWCGTRWSMIDPIGIRIDTLTNSEKYANRRFKVINLPALNENDESNFDYMYGVGFSTQMYQERRASFERNNDMASWLAQYMGEPIERDGAVFSPQDFRYYNGILPEGTPDRIFAACDPAWGSGDFVAMPVCYKYGSDIYVADVVYDNNDKRITQRLIADKVIEHNIAALQIEANKTTEEYAEGVDKLLRDAGKRINLTTKTASRTVGGKQQRIFDKAPDIRERMIFLENGKRSKPYQLFMQNVFSFKVIGKNKNDDAPDSLCMAIEMDGMTSPNAMVMSRLW